MDRREEGRPIREHSVQNVPSVFLRAKKASTDQGQAEMDLERTRCGGDPFHRLLK